MSGVRLPLTGMRAAIGSTFLQTATIYRKSSVSDGSGGQTNSYTSVGTFPCSLSKFPIRPREYERAPGIQAYSDWVFNFAWDVEVHQTDRIDCDNRHFEVVGQGLSTFSVSNHVLAQEIL